MLHAEVLAVDGMVCPARLDPCRASGFHIGERFPQHARYRELGELSLRFLCFHLVYHKPEAVAHVYETGIQCMATGGIENEACGIVLPADTQWVYFQRRFSVCQ